MVDLIYIGGTLAFFSLMLAYVRVCSRLGHAASAHDNQDGSRSEGSHS